MPQALATGKADRRGTLARRGWFVVGTPATTRHSANMHHPVLFLILGLVLASSVAAQTRPAPPPPPPEAKQFDFWIGEWTVTRPDGRVVGTNKIERIAGGHGLLENWTSAGGGTGKSLNAYNTAKRQWQQFWVGGDGTILELAGGLDAQGRMVLSSAAAGGAGPMNRIAWTPNSDGTVRQYWEVSKDGGKTWSLAFDGRYARKNE